MNNLESSSTIEQNSSGVDFDKLLGDITQLKNEVEGKTNFLTNDGTNRSIAELEQQVELSLVSSETDALKEEIIRSRRPSTDTITQLINPEKQLAKLDELRKKIVLEKQKVIGSRTTQPNNSTIALNEDFTLPEVGVNRQKAANTVDLLTQGGISSSIKGLLEKLGIRDRSA